MLDISFAGAALAGLLSFFTPCILPMVPFYLSYMAGMSMAELREEGGIAPGAQRRLLSSAVAFALGYIGETAHNREEDITFMHFPFE